SSRRRHTRSYGDWSSDVCSSDLQLFTESFVLAAAASIAGCALAYFALKIVVALIPAGTLPDETLIHMSVPVLLLALGITLLTTRSEERRVGKECRSRRWSYD